MQEGESYSKWLLELKGLSSSCNFKCKSCQKEFVDEMIRDTITLNTPHDVDLAEAGAFFRRGTKYSRIIRVYTKYSTNVKNQHGTEGS